MVRVGQPVLEHGRLEQTRVVAAHHLRRRNRRQVRRTLMLATRAQRLPKTEQRQRAGKQGRQ
jgi:hypothetical protein